MDRLADEALAISLEVNDRPGVADALANRGWAALQAGQLEAAGQDLAEGLRLFTELDDAPKAANCRQGLGILAVIQGRWGEAREHHSAALRTFRALQDDYSIGMSEVFVAGVDREQGDLEAAAMDRAAAVAYAISRFR